MHSKWLPKVLQDIPLAEEEDNGRNEMGIDVDRLVVEIPHTTERGANRARYGSVTVKNPPVVVALKPFRHLIKREKSLASRLSGPRSGCVVPHSPPFARLWLVGRNSEPGSGRHLPSRLVMCNVRRPEFPFKKSGKSRKRSK
ncbi:hypothetical protein PCL_08600 [Purpureocillium lilacinum]|uniref:Uncharacterized protein n=1 Tax=Purpureocillium lilacinum TaxID=33203 RepID=A0A2U3DR79_PURLI|nr:hypothetical protein PCL_08600 [Purpureocillium lilacinum]